VRTGRKEEFLEKKAGKTLEDIRIQKAFADTEAKRMRRDD